MGPRSIRREGPTTWYNLPVHTSCLSQSQWKRTGLEDGCIPYRSTHSLSSLHLTLDVPGNRSQRSPKTCHLATRLRCGAPHHDEIRVPDDVAGAEPLDLGRKMEKGDKHGQTLQVIVKKMSKAFKSNYTHHLINVGLHIETMVLQATRERETKSEITLPFAALQGPKCYLCHPLLLLQGHCRALEFQSSFCHFCGRSAITTCQDEV